MTKSFPHISERIFGRAQLIEWNAFRAILDSRAVRRIMGGDVSIDDERVKMKRNVRSQRLAARAAGEIVPVGEYTEYALTRDGIAVVPVQGVLAQKFDWLSAVCGWTTYEGLQELCEAMSKDYRVKAVLQDVESPGGEAAGMLDAADAFIALDQIKPVWAVANSYAYSAAYALAGSSSMLAVPRMGGLGSIGAVCVHCDESGFDEQNGLKYTAVFSGDRKIDGWEHAPLSPDARAALQSGVDHCRDLFAELVGRQGRMTKEQALATEAGVFMDEKAVNANLANEVANFDETLEMLIETVADRSSSISLAAPAAAPTARRKPNMTTPANAAKPAVTEPTPAPAHVQEPAPAPTAIAPVQQPAPTPAPAAHVDPNAYTLEHATQTSELCNLAGFASEASALIKARTPIAKVSEHLLAKKASAANALQTDATRPKAPNDATSWDQVVAHVNREMGFDAKK